MAKIGLQRVWKMVKSQGKVSEKSGNFGKDIEWQPCGYIHISKIQTSTTNLVFHACSAPFHARVH